MFKELIREVCLKYKRKRDDRSQNKEHSFKYKQYLKVLGKKVLFPQGLTCYQWWVGTKSLKNEKEVLLFL